MIVTVHHMTCDRDGCTARFNTTAARRWSDVHVEEDAANARWAVRTLNMDGTATEEHLCPRHAPEGTVVPRHRAAMDAAALAQPTHQNEEGGSRG